MTTRLTIRHTSQLSQHSRSSADRLTEVRTRATGSGGSGVLRSTFAYDLAGRQVSQADYDAGGVGAVFQRTASYNAKGQLASDATYTIRTDGKTYTSGTTYNYGSGIDYALGAVVSQTATSSVSGTSGSTSAVTAYQYRWFDGPQQSRISYSADGKTYNTYLAYDGASRLRVAEIQDGKPRYVEYVTDELGQIVYRREIGTVTGQTGNPQEVTYRFGGRPRTGDRRRARLGSASPARRGRRRRGSLG